MALTKHRQRRVDQLREGVLERRELGKTFAEICAELRTTVRTVRHILSAPEAERERKRRAHERALTLAPKAIGAIEGKLDAGDAATGLRLLEGLGILGKEAIQVNVNATNAMVSINAEEMESARRVVGEMKRRLQRGSETVTQPAENDPPRLPEAAPDGWQQ